MPDEPTTNPAAPAAGSPARQAGLSRNLTVQVLVAISLGVALGAVAPSWGRAMKPVGDTFINLVKMVIAPIIFLTIVLGVAGMQDMKRVGRVGGKAFLYFEIVSTIALVIGLVVVNLTRPGAGLDVAALAAGDVSRYTAASGEAVGLVGILTHVVPSSVVGAFANGEILQIVFFSLLCGLALLGVGEPARPLFVALERLSQVFFRLTGMALLFGVDRFMSEARAITNVIGNAVTTVVVAKSGGAFNATRHVEALEDRGPVEAGDTA